MQDPRLPAETVAKLAGCLAAAGLPSAVAAAGEAAAGGHVWEWGWRLSEAEPGLLRALVKTLRDPP